MPASPGHQRTLLAEVARAFYLHDLPKTKIGEAFGISRFQVARLLDQARATGVVTIEIHDSRADAHGSETDLASLLGVDSVKVIELADTSAEQRIEQFGAAVLTVAVQTIRPHTTVGLAWSRTLDLIAPSMPALPPCHLVQLTGAVETAGGSLFARILTQLDRQGGARTFPLHAPLVVDRRETADDLRRQPVVAETLAMADALDLAVVAIGGWTAGESAVYENIPSALRAQCAAAGVISEFSGILLNGEGHAVPTPLDGRVMAIRLPQLRAAKQVIGFAHGAGRAAAVRAAARSRTFTDLIIDRSLASALLAANDIPTHADP
ncbi:sugar-binding transcriptional regulator [Allobranchiibius huperziae]|uniref:DNA-binding transcriptional regulator LsrR (DeoR family) n=1 Tax=Allobranchiibius huperziae TaxID=1874116 RepID=A0A853DG27_9MICO|nr:sugar-binding domain-containing protein [Allobranchiibius huperziae]NYJ74919.1 DNA-binding transcriptional regulator LsrR (DeoR family) [Allobranchiibius huperziae]